MRRKGAGGTPEEAASGPAFHALSAADALAALDATPGGLSTAEADARRAQYGPNRMPEAPRPGLLLILARQFKSPLIFVLAAAGVVALAAGEAVEAAFIAAVLLLNAAVGGWQEWRAESSSRALRELLRLTATVRRDGARATLSAEELVPGDIVLLESGDSVPADLRLIEQQGLAVDESLLTGESVPVGKRVDGELSPDAPLADRDTAAHAGCLVVSGRAIGVVTATGAATAVGRLAHDVLSAAGGEPPLILRMRRFARTIGLVVVAASLVVGAIGVLVQGRELHEMFLFAVALCVSAIPEGLPVALTIALAVATRRMARRGVIVRHLAAVEGLGSCTLVASDKTGTLTRNELTVGELILPDGRRGEVSGTGYAPEGEIRWQGAPRTAADEPALDALLQAAALCNEGDLSRSGAEWRGQGDPTDIALLALAHKGGLVPEQLRAARRAAGGIPFEPERRYASAAFAAADGGAGVDVFVKGGPERVLEFCALSDADVEGWLRRAEDLAASGLRVLFFAGGRADVAPDPEQPPRELSPLGLVGLSDPLRAGARAAVEACHAAGVSVSMITGDHPVTALAIARQLGLAEREEEVVTGAELLALPPEQWPETVARARVFARVAPDQKLAIVEAERAAGHLVAVTGDGVNDAPALRVANIGVAMGRSGTAVAREAADLVIVDDRFETIVAGIEEGRIAYDNIRKVVFLLVSTGAAEVAMLGGALALGLPIPLTAVQILWLNLATNGLQDKALALEPGEGDALRRPPRPPDEPVFNRLMVRRTLISAAVMATVGIALFAWLLEAGRPVEEARNVLLLLMVLFENVHVGNCRSERRSIFARPPWKSPVLAACTAGALLLHVGAMYLPLGQRILGVAPVDAAMWLLLVPLALLLVVAMEADKFVVARRAARVRPGAAVGC